MTLQALHTQGRSWLSWGSQKADEAKRTAQTDYERAKGAAKRDISAAVGSVSGLRAEIQVNGSKP